MLLEFWSYLNDSWISQYIEIIKWCVVNTVFINECMKTNHERVSEANEWVISFHNELIKPYSQLNHLIICLLYTLIAF